MIQSLRRSCSLLTNNLIIIFTLYLLLKAVKLALKTKRSDGEGIYYSENESRDR